MPPDSSAQLLPTAINAEYVSGVLQRSGVPGTDRLRRLDIQESRNTLLSAIVRLRLEYEGPCEDAPRSLIVKTRLPEGLRLAWNGGPHEVGFYTQLAPATPAGLLPRCFDAVAESDGSSWHLL